MAKLIDVATALTEQLSLVTGLRATEYVPESINPPAAFVNLTGRTVDTWDRSVTATFDLVVLVSRTSARVGTATLYGFIDADSIDEALNENNDLGLSDGTRCAPGEYRSLGVEEVAAYGFFGGAIAVEVTTPQ